jgi:hypothetical protein
MEPTSHHESDATGPPVDAEEEKEHLVVDAVEHGVDPEDAIKLAERLARLEPLAAAYRDVDRRLATGYTLEEAEHVLLDDLPHPDPDT